MAVSVETYQQLVLEDREGHWELVCGRLRQKPPMTAEHNQAARLLGRLLDRQLELAHSTADTGTTRLRLSSGSCYEPDVCVIPMAAVRRLRERPGTFEVYEEPMPLVAEVWPPSTGAYNVEQKRRDY